MTPGAALAAIGVTNDDLLRTYRNNPFWATVGYFFVLASVVAAVLGGIASRNRRTQWLTGLAAVLIAVGLGISVRVSLDSFSSRNAPEVTAELVPSTNGVTLEGTVVQRGLKDDDEVGVYVLGQFRRQPSQVRGSADVIAFAELGAIDGEIDRQFSIPIEPGRYSSLLLAAVPQRRADSTTATKAESGSSTPPEIDPRRLRTCDQLLVAADVDRMTTCVELLVPRPVVLPALNADWQAGDPDTFELTVDAQNLMGDDVVRLRIFGNVGGDDTLLQGAEWAPAPNGILSRTVQMDLPTLTEAVCAVAAIEPEAKPEAPPSPLRTARTGTSRDSPPSVECDPACPPRPSAPIPSSTAPVDPRLVPPIEFVRTVIDMWQDLIYVRAHQADAFGKHDSGRRSQN